MIVKLLDPVHDETETETRRANGEEFSLVMLLNRENLYQPSINPNERACAPYVKKEIIVSSEH